MRFLAILFKKKKSYNTFSIDLIRISDLPNSLQGNFSEAEIFIRCKGKTSGYGVSILKPLTLPTD